MLLIGLGANLGDSVSQIRRAVEHLEKALHSTAACSSLWRTRPVDCLPKTPDFINAVAMFDSPVKPSPEALLDLLQKLEQQFGRQTARADNSPRELDLDLLLFDTQIICTKRLTLPHPRAQQRHFVLAPTAELTPDLIWPGTTKTVQDLLQALPERDWGEPIELANYR